MTAPLTIAIRGTNRTLTSVELANHPDVIELASVSERFGKAVRVCNLLTDAPDNAITLRVHASSDGYSTSLPFEEASRAGVIWFADTNGPLTTEQGGPFRFFIPNAAECKTAVLDKCANVKHVDRIEVE